jgi:hypothetical protein
VQTAVDLAAFVEEANWVIQWLEPDAARIGVPFFAVALIASAEQVTTALLGRERRFSIPAGKWPAPRGLAHR